MLPIMTTAVFINTSDTPVTETPSQTPTVIAPVVDTPDTTQSVELASCVATTLTNASESDDSDTRCYYCEINTRNLVISESTTVEKTWVRVDTLPPSSVHIVNSLGEWILPDATPETIDAVRRELYLKGWPIYKQLEAYQDALLGDRAKLTQMKEEFDMIRLQYPK